MPRTIAGQRQNVPVNRSVAGKRLIAYLPIIRRNKAKGSAASGTTTIATNAFSATAGNVIVVFVRAGTAAGGISTGVTDTAGNTYTQLVADAGQDPRMYIYYAKNIIGNAANVVTGTYSANVNTGYVYAVEYSGIDQISPIDISGSKEGTAATDLLSTPFSTAQTAEVIVMAVSQNAFATYSQGVNFTLLDGTFGSGGNYGGVEEYITNGVLSSYTAHITSTTSAQYTTVWVSLKAQIAQTGGRTITS